MSEHDQYLRRRSDRQPQPEPAAIIAAVLGIAWIVGVIVAVVMVLLK